MSDTLALAPDDAPGRAALKLDYRKPALIINAASGSTEDIREAAKAIAREFGLELRADYLEPSEIADAVAAIMADGCDLLISYGGDGTSRASGETAITHDIPLIPLPGGTMNMLPRLLYGDVEWDVALRSAFSAAVRDGERFHPRGDMNGHAFFCGGFVGKATRLNNVREALRDGSVGEAFEALRKVADDIDLDDTMRFGPLDAPEACEANLVNICMPGMKENAPTGSGIEVTGVGVESGLDLLSFGIRSILDSVRAAPQSNCFIVEAANISYAGKPDVLLDGEPLEMDAPLTLRLIEKGLRVLAPERPDGETLKDVVV